MSLIYTFLQIVMHAPYLQDAMHGMRSPLQLHRLVLHPVVQLQLMSSSQAFRTGGREVSLGNIDPSSRIYPIVFGGGSCGCWTLACLQTKAW